MLKRMKRNADLLAMLDDSVSRAYCPAFHSQMALLILANVNTLLIL
jgi:uncharacterized protein (UPF0332 family)